MKTSYHENGWTIVVDEDIRTLSTEQLHDICRMTVKNMVVIFKQQTLTPDQEVGICSSIGEFQYYPGNSDRLKHVRLNNGILRVTGMKDEHGEEGLFGHKAALDWHANQPSNPSRMPLIWLYGEQGTKGSRTSWINNILSFQDLDEDFKEELRGVKLYCGYQSGKYSNSKFFNDHVKKDNPIELVQINKEGQEGLFIPFLQVFGAVGYSEARFKSLMDRLVPHIMQEKYMYHHDWEDGDVVISEQWLSIHKRWAFEHMDKRVLHRIAFNYDKVYN